MNKKLTFVLLLALSNAIHINDDVADSQEAQPEFNFPAQQAQVDAAQAAQNWGMQANNVNQAANNIAQQASASSSASSFVQNTETQIQQNNAAQIQQNNAAQIQQNNAAQIQTKVEKAALPIVDLSAIPGPDITLIGLLWSFYQDLTAQGSTLSLIYAANLDNGDQTTSWRLVYQLVGSNLGIVYLATQLSGKDGKFTTDHIFMTKTLEEIIKLWGLGAGAQFKNLGVQNLLEVILSNNAFLQFAASEAKKAAVQARSESASIIESLKTENAQLKLQFQKSQDDAKNFQAKIAQYESQIQELNSQIQLLTAQIQQLTIQLKSASTVSAASTVIQNTDDSMSGWKRDRDQKADIKNNAASFQDSTQINTKSTRKGRNNNQFPNAVLNIGNSLQSDSLN